MRPGSSKKIDTLKTPGFRTQMKIGSALANQLPKLMGAKECAAKMKMSPQMLRRIECQALYKVQTRLTQIAQHENLL